MHLRVRGRRRTWRPSLWLWPPAVAPFPVPACRALLLVRLLPRLLGHLLARKGLVLRLLGRLLPRLLGMRKSGIHRLWLFLGLASSVAPWQL